MAAMRTERGLDRLVNFSDATVAIAITILILPLADEGTEVVDKGIGTFFNTHWWEVVAFLISFAVIARFWMVHHQVFEHVIGYNPALLWLNFLWLLSIVSIPFTAVVLSDSPNGQPAVYALYAGNLLLTSVAMQFIGLLVAHHPDLRSKDDDPTFDVVTGWATIVLMAVAGVLTVTVPSVGMYWFLVLLLIGPVEHAWRAVRRRQGARA